MISEGARVVGIVTGHAHGGRENPRGGRSVADPVFDADVNLLGLLNLLIKDESHLPTGSFKARGAVSKLLSLSRLELERGVITKDGSVSFRGLDRRFLRCDVNLTEHMDHLVDALADLP